MKKLPNIQTETAQWYNDVVYQAELADHSPVRGCMVIRPYGWSIWERIKDILDERIKETGHKNAAFPLLIPESFLKKEADHVEGFAPELAIVTIAGGKKLEEPLVIRPTSETIVHHMFSRWIKSYRDLPLKINQWANVIRWEMRTRPFLRTTEFFWQEGHTAHETREEASEEVSTMLQEYVRLAEDYLAIPVIPGRKSAHETFGGAEETHTFEAIMMDGKALQMGTSHLLSRNFAKAFEIEYQGREGKLEYPYLTSWGVTTRLIGAIILTHGDQNGLIMPPRIAPIQIVIVPILKKNADNQAVLDAAEKLYKDLRTDYRVELDLDDTKSPGAKFFAWELKGVPMRIELGPRDIANGVATVANRITGEKTPVALDAIVKETPQLLDAMQTQLFERAKKRLADQWQQAEKLVEFGPRLDKENVVFQTGWCGNGKCEDRLKEFKATIRCLLNDKKAPHCFHCDEASSSDVLVAKSY